MHALSMSKGEIFKEKTVNVVSVNKKQLKKYSFPTSLFISIRDIGELRMRVCATCIS